MVEVAPLVVTHAAAAPAAPPNTAQPPAPHTAIVATTASDTHTWNLVVLELFLQQAGLKTINMGPCVPVRELVRECRIRRTDLLAISTINGHGCIEAYELIRAIRAEPRLSRLHVVIGGNLGARGLASARSSNDALLAAGYDGAFTEDSQISDMTDHLARLLRGLDARVASATWPPRAG